MGDSYFDIVRGLSAELVLAVAALFALALDLGWLRREPHAERTKAVGVLTAVGLLLVGFRCARCWERNRSDCSAGRSSWTI